VAHAYNIGTPTQGKQLIAAWGEYLNQHTENEVQLEDWRLLVLDPNHN